MQCRPLIVPEWCRHRLISSRCFGLVLNRIWYPNQNVFRRHWFDDAIGQRSSSNGQHIVFKPSPKHLEEISWCRHHSGIIQGLHCKCFYSKLQIYFLQPNIMLATYSYTFWQVTQKYFVHFGLCEKKTTNDDIIQLISKKNVNNQLTLKK